MLASPNDAVSAVAPNGPMDGLEAELMKGTERRPKDPVIEAYKGSVDRTLLRENLRLTVEQRLIS
jgi:hypothetical protein